MQNLSMQVCFLSAKEKSLLQSHQLTGDNVQLQGVSVPPSGVCLFHTPSLPWWSPQVQEEYILNTQPPSVACCSVLVSLLGIDLDTERFQTVREQVEGTGYPYKGRNSKFWALLHFVFGSLPARHKPTRFLVLLFKSLVRAAYSARRLKAIPTNPLWLLLTFHFFFFFWLEVMLPPNDSSLWLWNYCFLRSEPISGNTGELVGTRLRIVCSFVPGNFVRFHSKRLSGSLASRGNLCRHLRLPSRFIQKAAVPVQVEAQLWTEQSFSALRTWGWDQS